MAKTYEERKTTIEAKIEETKGIIPAGATAEMRDLVRRTKFATPERAMELLDEAERKMRRMAPEFFAGMPEKAAETKKAAETAKVSLRGSEKQVAWAEKIIAAKKQAAIDAGISPEQWDAAASKIGSASTWIEMRNLPGKSIARIATIGEMAEIDAKSPKQRKDAADMRLAKLARVDVMIADNAPNREERVDAIIGAIAQRITDAHELILQDPSVWVQKYNHLFDHGFFDQSKPAAQDFRDAPADESAAGAAPQIENLTAEEIAAEYSDGMAKIVVNAGKNITGMMFDADALRPDAAAWRAAEILRRRAEKWTGNHAQELADALSEAVASSDSPHEAAEKIRAMEGNYAETLARTEMARAREEANIEIMHRQGVDQVQFLAAPDERMCPVCGAHHGKVYNIRDAPVLPLHPNCRCTLVPYTPPDEGVDRM